MHRIIALQRKNVCARFTCLVGLGYLLKFWLGLCASGWILVGMPRPSKPPIRFLEVLQGGIAIHLEDVVVVHSHSCFPSQETTNGHQTSNPRSPYLPASNLRSGHPVAWMVQSDPSKLPKYRNMFHRNQRKIDQIKEIEMRQLYLSPNYSYHARSYCGWMGCADNPCANSSPRRKLSPFAVNLKWSRLISRGGPRIDSPEAVVVVGGCLGLFFSPYFIFSNIDILVLEL